MSDLKAMTVINEITSATRNVYGYLVEVLIEFIIYGRKYQKLLMLNYTWKLL